MGLLPREGKFFDFFNQHAELAALAAVELQALFANLGELEIRSRAIEKNEKQADRSAGAWRSASSGPGC